MVNYQSHLLMDFQIDETEPIGYIDEGYAVNGTCECQKCGYEFDVGGWLPCDDAEVE